MQLVTLEEELLSTTEAAALTGRNMSVIRHAIWAGRLPAAGRTSLGRPLVRRDDLLAWDKRALRKPQKKGKEPWLKTAKALGVLGSATAGELAGYLSIHPGNVRKHLLILEAQEQVQRGKDGQWSLAQLASVTGGA